MIKKMQKIVITTLITFVILETQISCTAKIPSDLSGESIIPKPVSVTATGDYFAIKQGTDIYIRGESAELNQVGQYLAGRLRPATGFDIEVKSTVKAPKSGNIYLTLSADDTLAGDEGYKINITKKMLVLSAGTPEGLFRGIQTIRQILPSGIELDDKTGRSLGNCYRYHYRLS